MPLDFRSFARWYELSSDFPARRVRDSVKSDNRAAERFASFAVEDMSSVIFLYPVIRHVDDVELNRIGTHPVGNYFGTIRLASNCDHYWRRFVSAAANSMRSGEILGIN
jgi:hypothetical protein